MYDYLLKEFKSDPLYNRYNSENRLKFKRKLKDDNVFFKIRFV